MGQEVLDKDGPAPIVDIGDQAVLVASDIENRELTDKIRRAE